MRTCRRASGTCCFAIRSSNTCASRENYSWEGVNATYARASAMSAPAERDRYQAVMLDKRNPR